MEIQTTTSKGYRNNSGVFQDVGGTVHGMMLGALDWVNGDNDQCTELYVAGGGSIGNGTQFQFDRNITSFTTTSPGVDVMPDAGWDHLVYRARRP